MLALVFHFLVKAYVGWGSNVRCDNVTLLDLHGKSGIFQCVDWSGEINQCDLAGPVCC